MFMTKIVVDTNVLLSALFSNQGGSFRLVQTVLDYAEKGYIMNIVSVPLVLEYEEVLLRPKNKVQYPYLSENDLKLFIADIVSISHPVKLHFLWRPFLKDSGDDKVLETAVNGGASIIVTFNTKDFEGVEKHFGIRILTPKELFEQGVL
ncbi:MAG: putative toxin-antitoxin system toxin component, PIN family [Sulfuricurvum sp.]|nr:putative toxin-antitoxin system toxin component, PIN family [Sulfuricurvum sp.]